MEQNTSCLGSVQNRFSLAFSFGMILYFMERLGTLTESDLIMIDSYQAMLTSSQSYT